MTERSGPIRLILLTIFLFVSAVCLPVRAEEASRGPVDIEADSIAYDRDRNTYHARGKVLITYDGGTLSAESVIFNKATNVAEAEGDVVLKSENDTLEGDRVVFDTVAKTGVVYEGRMFVVKNHFYLKGSHIEKRGEATYRIKDASATTCDGNAPDWRLVGREINLTIDGYGILKDGKFLVKDFPVLYIPCLPFPAKTTRQTGLLFPYLAYSRDKSGLDVEIPFFWAISKNTDATFYQRYIEKRGFKEGIEFRYALGKDSFGTLYGDFLNDGRHVTEDLGSGLSRNWQTDRKRWSYYWNHETRFDPTFYARADVAKVSDAWYFKDFSSHNYYKEHYTAEEDRRYKKVSFVGDESLGSLTSTARVFKGWDRYSVNLLGRYTDDFSKPSNASTLQTYPELTLTAARQPVFGMTLLWEMNTAYNYFYRSEGQKGHLYDLEPVLSLPVSFGHVQLTPEVGWKGTFWQREDSDTGSDARRDERNLFVAGIGLSTELNRVYDVDGAKVDKIRHGIKPEVTYQYITDPQQGDLPDYVTSISGKNAVSYALTNTFTARLKDKDGKVSYLEMVRVKLAQTYDIKEARRDVHDAADKRRPLSQMDLEVDVNPTPYFSLAVRNTLNVYSGDWIQANYDVLLHDKRGDAVTVGYHYTRDAVEEIDMSLKAVLTKSLDALYVLRRNERDSRTLESTFGLNYRRQCWGISLSYTESYDDRSFMLNITLTGLGRFGG